VIPEQDLFNLLHLWRGFDEPSADGLLLDAFDAINGGKRVSFGQHRKAFDDRLLVVLFVVKDRPFSFGGDLVAGRALPSLAVFMCEAELT
jgi:hypothetical protein